MISESEYIKIIPLEHRKRYAQFFTPELISDFMASWVLGGRKGEIDILDPAFGLGVFCKSMHKLNSQIRVLGYDIDKTIYKYANEIFDRPEYNVKIINENYLTADWKEKYDGIICNPPYLKFHDYDNSALISIVNNRLNTNLNGFTNIYTLFLLKSISQMRSNARMAYIIPSEFLNSDYGVEVKRALLQSGVLRHVIIVDFTQCAFDDALTTACILLCENNKEIDSIRFSTINNIGTLSSSLTEYKEFASNQLNPEVKWKQYYEETSSSKYNHLVPFSTFAKVSRGIATGANSYFTFRESKIDSYNIPENCFRRCICHSTDVKNRVFTDDDFDELARHDKNVFLFDGCIDEKNLFVRKYIDLGESLEINKKYLTASRAPWYMIENRRPAPIWVSVFNRDGLRFVRNKAGVYNLTTFHCVYSNNEIDTNILFAYLVTSVAKEIFMDNSRQYGNGLVKFEPNDLNKGNVVDLRILSSEERDFIKKASSKLNCDESICERVISILDEFFRLKYTSGSLDAHSFSERLDSIYTDEIVLEEKKDKQPRIKQLNLFRLFEQYADSPILENTLAREEEWNYHNSNSKNCQVDLTKNILISLVKEDNAEHYIDQSATIYYTGKKFPSTVTLSKLYYFMPYIKRKGIRDLYIIKLARIGTRKEGQPDNDPNDFRLVFEIKFVKQLFEDYKPVELEIWHTFKDTTVEQILCER